jgi:hypothetical protein
MRDAGPNASCGRGSQQFRSDQTATFLHEKDFIKDENLRFTLPPPALLTSLWPSLCIRIVTRLGFISSLGVIRIVTWLGFMASLGLIHLIARLDSSLRST